MRARCFASFAALGSERLRARNRGLVVAWCDSLPSCSIPFAAMSLIRWRAVDGATLIRFQSATAEGPLHAGPLGQSLGKLVTKGLIF